MRKWIICLLGISVLFLFYFFSRNVLMYVYLNPYTEIKTFSYIAKTIKELDKAFKYAKFSSSREGYKYDYLYFNAYGSGFVKNNRIPNDLDFALGINLGEYNYSGINAYEISQNIVDKMNSFESGVIFYFNMFDKKRIYTTYTPLGLMGLHARQRADNIKNISEGLAETFLDKDYVKYTQKTLQDEESVFNVDVPYIMKSGEILIENRIPITLYSDLVRYNSIMPSYMREISIIPEFYVTINNSGRSKVIEIIPESFLGNRLQLSRRFFASNVFVHNKSVSFLKDISYINDKEKYLYYRQLSFKRHLQEMNNILIMEDRPVKLLKRLMQTADIISPVLPVETYNEISEFVYTNLNNHDIQLLNEYTNICGNIFNIMDSPSLFFTLLNNGELEIMYKNIQYTIASLERNGRMAPESIILLKDFQENVMAKIFDLTTRSELKTFREQAMIKYEKVYNTASKTVLNCLNKPEKIKEFIDIFNQIYENAGFHRVSLYWLDNKTIGIVEDEFTKNIKDFSMFAKENELIDIEYKLIKPNNIPEMKMRYDVYARDNSTDQENEYYKLLQDKLLNDRKRFSIKKKMILAD